MNQDQKAGTLIIIIAVSLMAVALLVSTGWGVPGFPLVLFQFEWGGGMTIEGYVPSDVIRVQTAYVLAFLVLIVGYGVARYLSLIPSIIKKHKVEESNKEQ